MRNKILLNINLLGGIHRFSQLLIQVVINSLSRFRFTCRYLQLFSLILITACQNHQDTDVQLCDLFESKLDSQSYLSEDDLNTISTKLIVPEKKPIPMLSAAKIIMTAAAFKHEIQQSEWERYAKIVDAILAGDVVTKQLFVDLDGDGVVEQLVEFSDTKQIILSFNYVIEHIPVPHAAGTVMGHKDVGDKHRARFNPKYFVANKFTPLEFSGQFRLFNNQPYLIQIVKNNKQHDSVQLTDKTSEQRLIISKAVWIQSESDSQQLIQIKQLCQFPIELDSDKKENK